ncbi:MAG: hypothetical protein IT463_11110 [Planctomycetes bacterium]|nr:hypothetical protein [Planctomycetota bacterium]
MKPLAVLKLVRLSALPSALADIFGGTAVALACGATLTHGRLPWLLVATAGIYLGGMGANDLLHLRKDRLLGKRRPLVTGEVSFGLASAVTVGLYALGLAGAALAGVALPALLLAGLTVLYNVLAAGRVQGVRVTHPRLQSAAGVAVIACCRALNVCLPALALLPHPWSCALLSWAAGSVFAYFCVVTSLSLLEDAGGGWPFLRPAQLVLLPIVLALPVNRLFQPGAAASPVLGTLAPMLVAAALLLQLWRVLDAARAEPTPQRLGACVATGIRGESLLMAAFALACAPQHPWLGLAALACYPAGRLLSRWISPT